LFISVKIGEMVLGQSKPTSYVADYYFKKSGTEARTRTRLQGSVSQHLHGATTESAVVTYLRSKHPGCEINLMNLEWR
jgi:hypothetical protein